jgi:ornithine cyclodeaminase/alanine dehydrogenase-like protein (mu-crystallin family)
MTLLLDERAVASLLRWEDLIDLMARTLVEFSLRRAVQPVRTVLSFPSHGSFLGVMPGYLTQSGALGIKVVAVAPRNSGRGLKTHLATILLVDAETGALLAILDGRLITEMRTAAVSAAASRELGLRYASKLTILGSGVQARSHLEAFRRVHYLEWARVWSPSPESREAFARAQSKVCDFPVEAMDSVKEAVHGAELLVTATSSRDTVLKGAWLEEGMHITAVGACVPDHHELDTEAIRRSRVYVDSRAAARVEAGDLLFSQSEWGPGPDDVQGEIGEVFCGLAKGRTDDAQITIFKSLGLAVEDAATADLVYRLAREKGAGAELSL